MRLTFSPNSIAMPRRVRESAKRFSKRCRMAPAKPAAAMHRRSVYLRGESVQQPRQAALEARDGRLHAAGEEALEQRELAALDQVAHVGVSEARLEAPSALRMPAAGQLAQREADRVVVDGGHDPVQQCGV